MGRLAIAVLPAILVVASAATQRAGAATPIPRYRTPITVRYEGVLQLEGHYARPGEKRPHRSIQRFTTDGVNRTRLDWTTWALNDTAGPAESFLVSGARAFHRGAPDQSWRELSGDEAVLARLEAQAGLPEMIVHDRFVAGLSFDRGRRGIDAVRVARAHPRLGDVVNAIHYEHDASLMPPQLSMRVFDSGNQWTLEARRTAADSGAVAESLLATPVRLEPPPAEARTPPTLRRVADGVWALDQEDVDARSLVVEFARYLVVIEAADGSANGERMVDAVIARWPTKPIRLAFFSHYHPHYTGGLRALVAAGATIVTTTGNADFVRDVALYPFHIAPDRLARQPRPLKLHTFRGRVELADSTQRLVVIDIGQRSNHTDEFAIFWLPRARLLFEAEQGWVTTGGALRAGRRAEGFLRILADEHLDVDRLVQAWPMRGTRAEMTRAELEGLVRTASLERSRGSR